jgi:hypothetical protein
MPFADGLAQPPQHGDHWKNPDPAQAIDIDWRNFSKSRGNAAAVGWVKRSGPTKIAAIGGSVATLLDPPYAIAPGYQEATDWQPNRLAA